VRRPVPGPLQGHCRQGTRSPLCPQGRYTAIARTVPLPRFLTEQITASFAGKGPDDLVFQGTRGGVLRDGNFNRRTFGPAAIAIGEPRLTPHGIRHTAASLAIAAGGNVKVVQQMLGHATPSMTLDLYGHLFPDQLDDVADRLDVIGRATADNSADVLRTDVLRIFCGLFAD